MRTLYQANTANFPRLKTDVFFADYENTYRYEGFMDSAIRYIEQAQLLNPTLWAQFVKQFTLQPDGSDKGWRGEFWGKTMRGAALTYAYTRNQTLYDILTKTVEDMLDTAEENGRISSYTAESELNGWATAWTNLSASGWSRTAPWKQPCKTPPHFPTFWR